MARRDDVEVLVNLTGRHAVASSTTHVGWVMLQVSRCERPSEICEVCADRGSALEIAVVIGAHWKWIKCRQDILGSEDLQGKLQDPLMDIDQWFSAYVDRRETKYCMNGVQSAKDTLALA
jgi:hypothetical protein